MDMDIQGLVSLQIMMFLLIGTGIVIRKLGIITPQGKTMLTDLVIDVILPCNIVHSFCIQLQKETVLAGLSVLVVSLVLQLCCTAIAAFCYRWAPKEKRTILQYGTVCSNAAFLGNPVVEQLYGSMGLLYASLYLIPQRIVMWSAGISYFTGQVSKKDVVKKVLTHPCIIAVAIGLVIMVTGLELPSFLDKTISTLGQCTTAMTMLLIGAILADAGWSHMITPLTLLYALIRLILLPGAVLLGCLLFRVDALAAGVCVVLAAMPAGSITAILAAKYHADEVFASACVVFTTVLSMVFLPLWCLVLQAVL